MTGIHLAAEPSWSDDRLGSRVRAALYLKQEVGEGGKFTMQQVRRAIPNINQIDRRIRDLRPAGWVILDYRQAPGLAPKELLLETIGAPVWERSHRSTGLRYISSRVRMEVMTRDNNRCVRCGIAAGEAYPGEPLTAARLTIGHVNPVAHGGKSSPETLVTECARCNETAKTLTAPRYSMEQVWDRVSGLGKAPATHVLDWLIHDRREMSPEERAYLEIRQLPAAQREEIKRRLVKKLVS